MLKLFTAASLLYGLCAFSMEMPMSVAPKEVVKLDLWVFGLDRPDESKVQQKELPEELKIALKRLST